MVSDYAAHAEKEHQRHSKDAYHITYAHRNTSTKSSLCCMSQGSSSDRLLSKFVLPAQSINLREKSIVSPPERSGNAQAFPKLAEEDLRFSMKMMFEPVYRAEVQPVLAVKSQ